MPPSTRGSTSGASSSSSPVPPAPTALLGKAAKQLDELEKRRATLAAQLDEAKQARQANPGRGNNAELAKLQDRVHHAAAQLERLRVDRATQLGKLEKAERLLESCERSLQALSLDDTPAPRREADEPVVTPVVTPLAAAAAAAAAQVASNASRITPEEAAARKREADLTDAHKRATNAKDAAVKAFEEARKGVETAKAAAEAVFDADAYTGRADRVATAGLDNYLRSLSLPPASEPPRRGQPDPRFDAYLEHFTEVDESGSRRLRAQLQEPREAFAAFSALHGAMQANSYVQSLLNRMLPDDVSAISISLRNGGADLETIVRPMVVDTFRMEMHMSQGLVEAADRSRDSMLPRRNQLVSGSTINRTEVFAVAERNRVLLQLQEMPMHRASIIEGAVHQICSILRGTVLSDHARAQDAVAAATQRKDQAWAAQSEPLRQWVTAKRELEAASGELRTLVEERRQREAEAAKAAAPIRTGPSDAAIPQTEIVSSSAGDAEARRLKLTGDRQKHTEATETARQALAQMDADIRQAELDLRRAEDQFETADAAQARGRAGARRQHSAQRQEVGRLRRDLDDVEAQLRQARTDFDRNPSRQALMSDRAWDRAVERHVEPDDAALRARARQTGYAGAYASRSDMAQAITDIHERISQQPEFQAVLAARTRAEFERAVAAELPGGVTDLVHDHGREVGRGFSNDLDQTERATTLTQSNFSLQFVQGRVVISHLYPYVPHRQLMTAS